MTSEHEGPSGLAAGTSSSTLDRGLLADYLGARRRLVAPGDVGVVVGSRRRVPGLSRSEVADRARVSPEYYIRLEQGRDQHPSPQVVSALAEALCLDDTATDFVLELAGHRPRVFARGRQICCREG